SRPSPIGSAIALPPHTAAARRTRHPEAVPDADWPERRMVARGRSLRRQRVISRYLDILGLPALVHVPGLDAILVVYRLDPADLPQRLLGRLHVAGGIVSPALEQQWPAVP